MKPKNYSSKKNLPKNIAFVNNRLLLFLFLFFVLIQLSFKIYSLSEKNTIKQNSSKPNIIYILADDLGYGDLSFLGQKKFKTPNIDKLAKEGVFFTQHYAGTSVCAPSRSSLLTGLHTGHTFIRGNKEISPEGQFPLPKNTYSLSKMLQKEGYTTGAFGKWGLGYPGSEGDPLQQGFDTFYGYNCQRLGHHYYPYHLWDNNKKVILEGNSGKKKEQYAPNLIHKKALEFIDKNKKNTFFLFYPSVIPHAELAAPKSYVEKFIGKLDPEKTFKGTDDGKEYREGNYESQTHAHATFAAMITLLDEQVGEIVQKVKDLGLEKNTIIIFTSDNGAHQEGGADPDFFNSNGGLRGYKRDLFEGGIRVPMMVKWKGKIKEGSKTNHISAFWDVFPTFLEIAKQKPEEKLDGISFLPTLLGTKSQKQHDYLYWEFHELGGRQAIRKNNWKLVKNNVKKTPTFFLFDLDNDPFEKNNLAEKFKEKRIELTKILENARTPSEYFIFE
ncbi:MAG: arylsulfatase [Flavobacteriia bacterium]|nr:arylsulfatase [Flavobacteriia bacterium]PIV95543.1 MAG: arylsulfatase [Flavobacteriaceae bacterium CG17_big_fil_post_rev_8_21_14_2_50_31_13]PIX13513.1 MAG: arylsulfatase [Flavobacteriaceae bacterium CG_4_8_14_3_um_filter_31_8]PIY15737.1 MAG: arylsulfatase [Flavobacteriaceae bacterium CG_4_10_14_3_um_filter_31_253]PIZ09463.1 MAG: arylsulfatase [Flavobacteriaceae bacterium CG_4_10_14_0_8_um_filter_31_99]PJC09166.1 MAG: arylsulfatase [Flavobacteriaceae bacterium CG_4_9_14_0_8_um_filter_31_91]